METDKTVQLKIQFNAWDKLHRDPFKILHSESKASPSPTICTYPLYDQGTLLNTVCCSQGLDDRSLTVVSTLHHHDPFIQPSLQNILHSISGQNVSWLLPGKPQPPAPRSGRYNSSTEYHGWDLCTPINLPSHRHQAHRAVPVHT